MSRVNEQYSRGKRARLLSGVGAITLGMGIGLFFSGFLTPYTMPLLLIGLLAHVWGMVYEHKLERASAGVRLGWAELLYWSCWIALLIFSVYVAVSYLRI